MAQLTVFILLFAALAGSDAWNVTFSEDGAVHLWSTKKGETPFFTSRILGVPPLGPGKDCSPEDGQTTCRQWDSYKVHIRKQVGCANIVLESVEEVGPEVVIESVINAKGHVYGGPEQFRQYWPLDNVKFADYSYVTKMEDNQGIAEPYWLFSDGYSVYVNPRMSLFLEQNIREENTLVFIGQNKYPYPYPAYLVSDVILCEAQDAREVHMLAVNDILNKPTGIPDERMIRSPIWSTWARYKQDINEEIVLDFADEIIANGFDNSQLEIDDFWETCYGSLTFDKNKFPDMKGLSQTLKAKGFRVTLWIHPFINLNCDPYYTEALEKSYLVRDTTGNAETTWWNGKAGAIDFTNPEAVSWWSNRITAMIEENGIDSLKFDAGETSWMPQTPVLSGDITLQPNIYTLKYVEAVAQFGDMIEVRVAHHSQHLPVFVRMLDKDSRWDFENGLPTLITTLLEMNMVGYPIVLPDMVGGNGYQGAPSKELFIRWLQANVFMPSIQYSYVPWDYDQETVDISLNYTKLHEEYSEQIIELLKKAVRDGTPLNPPIWWIDPQDTEAQVIADEFLLGEDILVAPVIEEGARARDIYLPRGNWRHGIHPEMPVTEGPTWLRNYPAALSELPYFIREH